MEVNLNSWNLANKTEIPTTSTHIANYFSTILRDGSTIAVLPSLELVKNYINDYPLSINQHFKVLYIDQVKQAKLSQI